MEHIIYVVEWPAPRIAISSKWKHLSQERPGLSGASGGKQRVSNRSHVQE